MDIHNCYIHAMPARDHKAVDGLYNKKIRRSCIQCGQWLDDIEGRTRWYGYKEPA